MPRRESRVAGASLACILALAAALLAARPASPPPCQEGAAPPDRLLFTRGVEKGPLQAALGILRERLERSGADRAAEGGKLREEVRPLPGPAGAKGTSAVGGDLGLTVYRAVRDARAASGYALDFLEASGLLRVYGFDAKRGVDAMVGVKIEDEGKGRKDHGEKGEREGEKGEEGELEEQVERAVDRLLTALDAERRAADAPDAAPGEEGEESVRWLSDEDPIDLGFRWDYVASGGETLAQVKLVLETSSLGRAKLRRGDSILAINGAPVTSPPLFGRAFGGLKAGAPLAVTVRRGGEKLELAGKVERASEVVPAYEQREIGAKLPPFRAALGGAPVEVGGAKAAAVTIVCLFDPRRPDTLRDAAVLSWLRDRHAPGQVAIAGIAIRASDAEVKAAMEELACGWPAAADPDGRLAEATWTIQLPALLVADRDGVVRRRQARGGELQREVRRLLAAGH